MKTTFLAVMLLAAAGLAAAPKPAFEWTGAGSPTDKELRQLKADGSTINRPLPAAEPVSGKPSIRLDGESMIVIPGRHDGAQTIRVLVKYPEKPQGAVISRHRTEDSMRGLEMGFASANYYTFDGAKPAAQVSDGTRDTIRSIFDAKAPEFAPGKWYECILRFSPGDRLTLWVIDHDSKTILTQRSVECPKISALSRKAGDGLLGFGGRRNNSRSCTMLAPAGTLLGGITVWNSALEDDELAVILGLRDSAAGELNQKPTTRYVNGTAGDDRNDGLSKEKAFRTIQRVADAVNPGDTVLIAPGLYYETVRFTRGGNAGQPVTFRADGEPGCVTVTAADREIREKQKKWQMEDPALGLYSVPFDHIPSRVLYSGTDLFPCSTLEGLKTFMLKDGYPAPENGFFFDASTRKLYVRLHPSKKYGPTDPNQHTMSVSPVFAGGYNGHHVYQMKDSNFFIEPRKPMYLVFSGFRFETPGTAGIVTGGSDIVVRDSLFKGCRAAVWGFSNAKNIFVENCLYDQAYTYSDTLDTIAKWVNTDLPKKHTFYFWARKGMNRDTEMMKNYETGIVGGVGENWHVRNNLIDESFEGMSSWCVDRSKSMQVYGNVFRRVVDNAVETENHAADMRIYNNLFEDVFEPVSWQPLGGTPWPGPIYVYRNVFTCTPAFKPLADALLVSNFRPGAFKIGAAGRNWEHPHMGNVKVSQLAAKVSKRFIAVPDPGFLAFNNTVIWPYGNLFTTPMPVVGPAARDLANFRFFNNIFNVDRMHKLPEWKGGLFEFYRNYSTGFAPDNPHPGIIAGQDGIEAVDPASLKLKNDYTLDSGSPARGKGFLIFDEPDASLDLGAVPYGTRWELTAGPGSSVDPAELSAFSRNVFYHPTLIRTAGPVPGRWGVYSMGETVTVSLGKTAAAPAKIRLVFRTTEEESSTALLRGGSFSVILVAADGKSILKLSDGKTEKTLPLEAASRDLWRTVGIDLAAEGLVKPPAGTVWRAEVGRNPVYDIELL